MNKCWNYSELSHSAKEAGGPETFLGGIYNEGYTDGETEGYSNGKSEGIVKGGIIGIAIPLLATAGFAIKDKIDYIRKSKKNKKRNAYIAEKSRELNNYIINSTTSKNEEEDSYVAEED